MMNPELNHPVILALGWMLIHSLWQATLIGLLIRGLWLFISRKYASWRYGLALTGLLLILIVASISFVYYLGQYSHAARLPDSIAETYHEGPLSVIDAVDIIPAAPENTMAGTPVDFELIDPVFSWEHYLPYLVLLWGLGAWIMGLRLVGSWWYMRRVSRQGIAHPDTFWAKRFAGMCRRMGLNRRVQLYFSRLVDEPLTFGHLKPVILFPLVLVNQLSVEQVEAILLHELAHIRRWDYLVNWLQSVLELLFFFHPAVWWLSGEVRKAREHCCDDLVLKKGQTSRKLYAQTLTQIAALSFTPKTKLVMSVQGIKDAFSQRVLRLYGQHQAVLDWRKPVLSLALGCMLLPVLWLTQPALFIDVSAAAEKQELTTDGEEDNVLDSDLFVPQSSPIITAPVEIPFTESSIELPEDQFYDQLSLEALIDPRRMVPWEVLATIPVLDPTEQQDQLIFSGPIAPQALVSNEPTFIVDGRQIPDGAPYRQIGRDDIEKFIWRHVPWSPELTQRIPPENRNGVIEIITKDGNWPGGRPYWPQLIRSRERYEGEHMTSWFPLGKANSRKELGGAEGTAFLPGANRALRKINGSGQESHAILNGRVLQKGEVVEVNRHEMFGSRWLPAIGLYDGSGQLIYGVTTPPEIADRTMKLELKDGYHAIIGKYPCDNRIYLRSYTNVNQFPIDYNFYEQLNRGFADVPARKALRYCKDRPEVTYSKDPINAAIPTFIVDGQAIPEDAPITRAEPAEVIKREFLTPDLERAPMLIDKGIIRMATKSGNWKGGRPYWPHEIKGKEINELGQPVYTSLNGRILKDEETIVINAYETTYLMGLHVVGVYDEHGQLVLGQPTPPELEPATYRLQFQNNYTVVAPKYPCDANLSIGLVFTIDGLKAQGNLWLQIQELEKVTPQMIEQHCHQTAEKKERRTVHKPVTPEPLFIIDGQVINPAEPYCEIPNDQLTTAAFLLPAEAVARYGADARNGAVILTSKAGAEAWKEGKPYSPLYKLLGGDRQTGQIENYIDCDHYFIDGQPVSMDDFNHFNIFSFVPGSITSTNVATVYGLDKKSVNLSQLQEQVKDRGIAYELGSGVVVVKYLEDCRNPIKMARIHSPLTAHLGQEERRLKEMISFRERSIPCDDDLEQENTPFDQQDVLEMIDKNLQFVSLQQKLKNSLNIYPSPFTREVKIAFTLSETAYTKVIILGAEGKLITQLVDKKLNGGQHEFSWDAGNQSPGNYWVRIEAGEATLVRPLLKQ